MSGLDWNKVEAKLKALMDNTNPVDVYLKLNIVAPLRDRFYNGERSLRLYNEVMNIRVRSQQPSTPPPARSTP
ncbi:MAG TPA: hypothetical protein VLY03_03560 [Bacteroidota bacterium]|nr:hypothetical protein [Bacteroidota bacterium]